MRRVNKVLRSHQKPGNIDLSRIDIPVFCMTAMLANINSICQRFRRDFPTLGTVLRGFELLSWGLDIESSSLSQFVLKHLAKGE
jgi:hypothetical protein